MKKLLILLITALLFSSVPVAVNAAPVEEAPLIFADSTRRTPFSDCLEGFTVINVSASTLDLADYKVWYGRAANQTVLNSLKPAAVKFEMPLAEEKGKYLLAPGERAYVWFVYSTTYTTEVDVPDGKAMLVEKGADGKPLYRVDVFRKCIEQLSAEGSYNVSRVAESTLVVPLDVTTGTVFGANGSYKNKADHVNLQNSYFIRLYLTDINAKSCADAFCTADLDGTDNGTYHNADGSVKVNFGTFTYERVEGQVAMRTSAFLAGTYLFGNAYAEEAVDPVAPAPEGAFRVMSLNVLNDDYKASRFGYIEKTVSTLAPHIIGLQECREGFNSMVDNIKKQGYASVVSTLTDDAQDSSIINCVPVLYRTDRYELEEGSAGARRFKEKYMDSWTKSLCWCVLRERDSGARIIVINVHFAVYSSSYENITSTQVEKQRESNAEEVIAQIAALREKYGYLPAVVLGDFNMDEPERANRILQTELRDTAYLADESYPWMATYHNSLEKGQSGNYPIDHVFVSSGDFTVIRSLPYTAPLGRKASDHYPIYADLRLEKNGNTSCADTHKSDSPLIIVDATRRVPAMGGSSDMLEGFTVMNVSSEPVDLSHVLAWSASAKTARALELTKPAAVTTVMRLSERTGAYVLKPGQKAFIWCVYSSVYKSEVQTPEGMKRLVEQGEDGAPVYRTDVFREALAYLAANNGDEYEVSAIEDSTLIVPLDRTTRDAFGDNGAYRSLARSFNLANSAYIRLYLTYDTAKDAGDAFCIAELDGTGDGTFIKASGEVGVNYGTYKYVPGEGAAMKVDSFAKNTYYFGTNTDGLPVIEITEAATTVPEDSGAASDVTEDTRSTTAAPVTSDVPVGSGGAGTAVYVILGAAAAAVLAAVLILAKRKQGSARLSK